MKLSTSAPLKTRETRYRSYVNLSDRLNASGTMSNSDVLVEGTALFQWMKNGDTIHAADNITAVTNTLVLNSLQEMIWVIIYVK